MSVKQRFIDFLKYKKIGQKRFAQSIGMSDGYVNAIRVSIQPDTLDKIAMQYPELNTGWLITGNGEMLNSDKKVYHTKLIDGLSMVEESGNKPYTNGHGAG